MVEFYIIIHSLCWLFTISGFLGCLLISGRDQLCSSESIKAVLSKTSNISVIVERNDS